MCVDVALVEPLALGKLRVLDVALVAGLVDLAVSDAGVARHVCGYGNEIDWCVYGSLFECEVCLLLLFRDD